VIDSPMKRAVAAVAASLLLLFSIKVAPAADAPAGATTTHWSGTTTAGCQTFTTGQSRCRAVQNVKFTLIQENSKIKGTYECAYGNQPCRGQELKGEITDGSLNGENLFLRVSTPDKSVCLYRGVLSGRAGKGTYSCKGGTQTDERGTWRIQLAE
jgi:hypothetical protein